MSDIEKGKRLVTQIQSTRNDKQLTKLKNSEGFLKDYYSLSKELLARVLLRFNQHKANLTYFKEYKYTDTSEAIAKLQELPKYAVWEVVIRPFVPKRSLPQNRLLRAWEKLVADYTGDTPKSVHKDLLDEFPVYVTRKNFLGKEVTVQKTTSDFDKKEMSEYMNKVEMFVNSGLGVQLPRPEDFAMDYNG